MGAAVSVEQLIRKFRNYYELLFGEQENPGREVTRVFSFTRGRMVERTVDHAFQVETTDFQSAVPCDTS
jgi:hypothetical protein